MGTYVQDPLRHLHMLCYLFGIMTALQQYVRAYIPRRATNTEHPCLRTLIKRIEEQKRLQEEADNLLADVKKPDFDTAPLIKYLRDNDFDQILSSDFKIKIDLKSKNSEEWKIIKDEVRKKMGAKYLSAGKTPASESVSEEIDTSAIYEWIDERIGTTVIVIEGENEFEMPWEELHANHAWRHTLGNKSCTCKQPTKIIFNNKPYPLPECLESIQGSHEANMWFLSPSGIQLNWTDGTSTYLPYGHPDLRIIEQSLLGEHIKKLCKCHYRIHPEGVFF